MKIIILLLLAACLFQHYSATAQEESGWADSVGYKQQIMPTKSLRQVLYSPSGGTLYSVNLDTLYRIHHWDAATGKLLKRQLVDKSGYTRLLSVVVSNDCRTYSVSGVLNDNKVHIKTYSLHTDLLVHDVIPAVTGIPNIIECSAVFDSTKQQLSVFYTLLYDNSSPYGPSGIRDGGVLHYTLSNTSAELLYSEKGAAARYSIASGKNKMAWVGYFHNISYYKGVVNSDQKWMKFFLRDSAFTYQQNLTFEASGSIIYTAIHAPNYLPFLTNDGKHYFFVDHKNVRHWLLTPFDSVASFTLPFIPTFITASAENTHLIFIADTKILLYHISSNSITDSIILPFTVSIAASRAHSHDVALVSNDSFLRIKQLPFTNPSIKTDFSCTHTKQYVDSAITLYPKSITPFARYRWDFGDGTTDTNDIAIHEYSKPGTYSLQLIVTDSFGVNTSIVKKNFITILPQLLPAFSATPRTGKAPLTVQFTDESKGAIISWKWDFGDNRTDTLQHPKHTFSGNKYFDITLSVSDGLSTKILKQPFYINGDTIPIDTFSVRKKWVNQSQNQPYLDSYSMNYTNSYSKGILGKDGKIYVYLKQCQTKTFGYPEKYTNFYYPMLSVMSISEDAKDVSEIKSYFAYDSGGNCDESNIVSGQMIFRNEAFVTSFTRMYNQFYSGGSNPDGIYFSNRGFFQPTGWTHNFEYSFIPDGTDIFLFRGKGYSSSLQFFRNQTTLIASDSLVGDVMRPLVSADSQQITVFCNPYQSQGDSIKWLLQKIYSSDGHLLNEKHIVKNITVRLTDIADLGWGEYLVCGSIGYYKGYLAKIGSDGRIAWEYTASTWNSFNKLQKLSTGHYAAWGIPLDGLNHGFIAFRSDGTILADNRLTGAMNGFSPSDFVVGAGNNSLWFIGSENVPSQGQRAAVYLCTNPMSAVTEVEEKSVSTIPSTFLVEIYPMPASSDITVRVSSPSVCQAKVSLVSAIGVEWPLPEQELVSGINEFHIPTDGLVAGMYSIRLRCSNEVRVIPVVVVR